MSVNLSANPFIIQPNRTELSAELIRSNKDARTKSLTDNPSQTNPQTTQPSDGNNRNFFTLTPAQSQRFSSLKNNEPNSQRSQNQPVSQYLLTEDLSRQEELESLVRLDVFA